MKNRFLIEQNIKSKADFVRSCAERRPRNISDLANKIGQTRATVYKLIDYFGLTKQEKKALFEPFANGSMDDIEPKKLAPKSLPYGGSFHRFNFMGAIFYVYRTTAKNPVYILRYRKGKLDYASERETKYGTQIYFNDANGNRISILKPNFMYCYYHKLQDIPAGKRIEVRGEWYERSALKAVPIAKSKKNSNHYAIERAKDMFIEGESKKAMAELRAFILSEIDREKPSKNPWE